MTHEPTLTSTDEPADDANRHDASDQDDTYELDIDQNISIDQALEEASAAVEASAAQGPLRVSDAAQGFDAAPSGSAPAAVPADGLTQAAGSAELASLRRRVTALEEELQQAQDGRMRTLADYDNFRKRSDREKEQLRRYALADPLKELFGVFDNLERAIAAPGASADDLKLGLDMVMRQLADALKRFGVEVVESEGEPFDPTLHEAVSRQERDDIAVPTVVAQMQKGYRLHDRLLRPAMVVVAMPTQPAPPTGGDGSPAENADG
ncbi:MAG: nucleotide exchange factor GrpE [Acidobacteriota bacterium]